MKATPSIAILIGALSVITLGACDKRVPEPAPEPPRPKVSAEPEPPEPTDLNKDDLVIGTGTEAKTGDTVSVNYTGRLLKTNFMFDTSIGKSPFDFKIGAGTVIKGWDEGVVGMKVGGKRKLTIPSKLGYGAAGSPPKIPPNATLVFEIELLTVKGVGDAGVADAGHSDGGGTKEKKKETKK